MVPMERQPRNYGVRYLVTKPSGEKYFETNLSKIQAGFQYEEANNLLSASTTRAKREGRWRVHRINESGQAYNHFTTDFGSIQPGELFDEVGD